MSDTVKDKLWNTTEVLTWQDDADGNDLNEPQPGSLIAPGQPTSIDGNLRRIKSEVKQFALDPAWVNYLGCGTSNPPGVPLGAPNPGYPQIVSGSQDSFTLVGNWRDSPYQIAVVSRMVRVVFKDAAGHRAVSPIKAVTVLGNATTVQLDTGTLAVGTWTNNVSYVEFSAINPASNPLPGAPEWTFNTVTQGWELVQGTISAFPSGPAGGDLTGLYPGPLVASLQLMPVAPTVGTGNRGPIAPTAPTTTPPALGTMDVFGWAKTGVLPGTGTPEWRPQDVGSILDFIGRPLVDGNVLQFTGTDAKGYITIPTKLFNADGTQLQVILQYITKDLGAIGTAENSATLVWTTPFPTACVVFVSAYMTTGKTSLFVNVDGGGGNPLTTSLNQVIVQYATSDNSHPVVKLVALGVGY